MKVGIVTEELYPVFLISGDKSSIRNYEDKIRVPSSLLHRYENVMMAFHKVQSEIKELYEEQTGGKNK